MVAFGARFLHGANSVSKTTLRPLGGERTELAVGNEEGRAQLHVCQTPPTPPPPASAPQTPQGSLQGILCCDAAKFLGNKPTVTAAAVVAAAAAAMATYNLDRGAADAVTPNLYPKRMRRQRRRRRRHARTAQEAGSDVPQFVGASSSQDAHRDRHGMVEIGDLDKVLLPSKSNQVKL